MWRGRKRKKKKLRKEEKKKKKKKKEKKTTTCLFFVFLAHLPMTEIVFSRISNTSSFKAINKLRNISACARSLSNSFLKLVIAAARIDGS
jgi:hypothetical protein